MHDAWLTRGPSRSYPLPAQSVARILYLVRDPRAVALSFSRHLGVSVDETIRRMGRPGFTLWTTPSRRRTQIPQLLSSWSEHVQSWLSGCNARLLLLRYEDMLARPEHVLGNVIRFLGMECSPETLRSAINATSFDRLREQEMRDGFRECPPTNPEGFFWSGTRDRWRDLLTDQQQAELLRDHGPVMNRLGYSIPTP